MNLREFEGALDRIAPLRFAESWDNVGLLAGDRAANVARVLVTIDLTSAVLDEAVAASCDTVVAYHPVILKPVHRLARGHVLFDAIRAGVAVYCPHTALDAAPGGTNDVLGDVLGMTERRPLRSHPGFADEVKLVTFVPEADVEKVAAALGAAGAGVIGNYGACSFRTPGTGTFFGGEGANPVVGTRGTLERVPEIRLEMRAPKRKLDAVVAALRASHPYEEPAFDLLAITPHEPTSGMGRFGTIPEEPREALVERVLTGLGVASALVAGPRTGNVTRVATCAGAGGDLLGDAVAKGAEVYLTGELRHHDARVAEANGVTVIAALHSNSERAALGAYASAIRAGAPGVDVRVSTLDRDPFSIVTKGAPR
ncbi:MAG: Nif3-like dinuclear metal center hexameric protein [Polyangiaceae bacterium]